MSGSRALIGVVLALSFLAAETAPLHANAPPPWLDPIPTPKPTPTPAPNPEMWPSDPIPQPKPRRAGLFRTCGSGAGTGLVGIALAWGALWVGSRLVARGRDRTG